MSHNWNLVGHEWAVSALQRDISDGRLKHAYLITGAAGVGKRTLAMAFVKAILCEKGTGCGECRPCKLMASSNHPDVISVTPAVSGKIIKTESIAVDRIRELIKMLSLKPAEASRRVAIVTDFETANENASNAFLKTLEEPPGDAILILTAENAETLLPTIRSRCELISLRPLSSTAIKEALTERWQVPVEQAGLLAHLAGGRLGWAVAATQDDGQTLERRAQRLEEMEGLLGGSRIDRFIYAEVLAKDRNALKETLELWLSWWRDVMLVASNASAIPFNSDQLSALRTVADAVGVEAAARMVEAVQRTLGLLPRNINARLALEVLMLDLPKV
jgi:DNA polymerase-3 subunit delta'